MTAEQLKALAEEFLQRSAPIAIEMRISPANLVREFAHWVAPRLADDSSPMDEQILTRAEVAQMPATALLRATLAQIGKDVAANGESILFSLGNADDCRRLAEILGPFLVHDAVAE